MIDVLFFFKTIFFYFLNIDGTHFNILLLFEISLTTASGTLVSIFLIIIQFIVFKKIQ
jgi:hypothetical protein